MKLSLWGNWRGWDGHLTGFVEKACSLACGLTLRWGMQLLVFPMTDMQIQLSALWTESSDHQQRGLCVNSTDLVGPWCRGAFDLFIVNSHPPNTSHEEAAGKSTGDLDWSEMDKILCLINR